MKRVRDTSWCCRKQNCIRSECLRSLCIGLLCFASSICSNNARGDDDLTRCTTSLTGIVSHLLQKETIRFEFATPESAPVARRCADFPAELTLPVDSAVLIKILNTDGQPVAEVLYCRPLLKEGQKRVSISLAAPQLETSVGVTGPSDLFVQHFAWIDQNVCYARLPKWDRTTDRLVAAETPSVEVFSGDRLVHVAKMKSGCIGYGWLKWIHLHGVNLEKDDVSLKISHNTGELFGSLVSTVACLKNRAKASPEKKENKRQADR